MIKIEIPDLESIDPEVRRRIRSMRPVYLISLVPTDFWTGRHVHQEIYDREEAERLYEVLRETRSDIRWLYVAESLQVDFGFIPGSLYFGRRILRSLLVGVSEEEARKVLAEHEVGEIHLPR